MAIDIHKKMTPARQNSAARYIGVALAITVAFFASYAYASSVRSATTPAWAGSGTDASALNGAGASAGGGGCACCGGGTPQQTVKGSTNVAGGVQKVTIDLTGGQYSPNEITAKAGVPLELDFKGPASGCNGYVQSQQLGFSQDVSNGGTIKVPALQPGTYSFACSMNMYTASIVVK